MNKLKNSIWFSYPTDRKIQDTFKKKYDFLEKILNV